MTRPSATAVLLSVSLFAPAACVSDPSAVLLQPVAWTQTAAEREALCRQAFAAASAVVRTAARNPGNGRPLAVIVDVDETMLDNSPYQAALIRDGRSFDSDSWKRWCERAEAFAVPGAVAFAGECRERGVTVFYVTNRSVDVEGATRENLRACGLPVDAPAGIDVVLCRGEVDGERGKQGRRDRVAATHEVLLLIGDDLGDFVEPADSVELRREQVRGNAAEWGRRWFVLPNPMYGSWQRALVGDSGDPEEGMRRALSPTR